MISLLSVDVERWTVAGSFTISRGSKTYVDVIVCTVTDGKWQGRGEATPIYYHGESAEGCAATIVDYCRRIGSNNLERDRANIDLPRGAARNALDCALWDLEAKRAGAPVWQLAGLNKPMALPTAFTISIGTPAQMERDAQAAKNRGFSLLKCKLDGENDLARVSAVRQGAPDIRLIIDANESWNKSELVEASAQLAPLNVELIEQPVPRGCEADLIGGAPLIPFCADESCQDRSDLPSLAGFAAINIKLDKAGGLTEALALRTEASKSGKKIMVGCMLATSLGIAPAFLAGQQANWIDLDGALLLERDRKGALELHEGMLYPGPLWGMN